MFRITRKEEVFFDLFVETTELACTAAKKLDDLVTKLDDVEEKIKTIKKIEHDCDQSIHKIMKQLNRSFITPIDREDIYEIAKALDNITDEIECVAHRFTMFNVTSVTDYAGAFSNLIVFCTKELKDLMVELKNLKTSKIIAKKIIEVNRIENEGDDLYRVAMTALFSSQVDPVDVIKWKDIYDHLENTLDACEDVANIVEGVVMKNV